MIRQVDLDVLMSLRAAATQGQWTAREADNSRRGVLVVPVRPIDADQHGASVEDVRYYGGALVGESLFGRDAEYIAKLHAMAPELVREVVFLRAEIERIARLAKSREEGEMPF